LEKKEEEEEEELNKYVKLWKRDHRALAFTPFVIYQAPQRNGPIQKATQPQVKKISCPASTHYNKAGPGGRDAYRASRRGSARCPSAPGAFPSAEGTRTAA
jgi:hypothetical protein